MNRFEKRYLTVKELSSRINFKEDWIRSKVFKRQIPYYKIQGLIRFDELEINEWIRTYKKEIKNEF